MTPATVPGAPSPATGAAGDTQATVNWTVPSDGGSAIMNYTLTPYIGSTAGAPVNVTAGVPAHAIEALNFSAGFGTFIVIAPLVPILC